ncbi:DUF1127 domain-containing protein [Allorhizobium sp. BGMRC 0089]|uniref:DUF1127 domain-containing protein n=1 Tax=Allorhizobium sonneratiae TaxID=2934936 RepID=UPI002033360A|nr:DUF1127 domain-containing protein [Allorhizobium sonneratiae]MCM2293844.1 DUF1127 domain-containing protein [Allorhizobium sonneratiae]
MTTIEQSLYHRKNPSRTILRMQPWLKAVSILRSYLNRRDIIRLRDLDDSLLNDLGLTRAELEHDLACGFLSDPSHRLSLRVEQKSKHSSLSLG